MTTPTNNFKATQPQEVLFYGRTFQEYVKMFALELSDWQGCKLLDCPAGPASFIEEASEQGIDIVGCDPMYTDELAQILIESGISDIEQVIQNCEQYPQLLSQKFYDSLEVMQEYATKALKIFARSYVVGKEKNRYIQASLPNLPFDNQSFDLVLSGNFLFIYSKLYNKNLEHLDYQFHRQAILELLRISKREVRIFPIPCIEGRVNKYASQLLADLEVEGVVAQTIPVEYEVFQGQNLMWRLTR